jgi:hypothetical protein
MYCTLYVLYIHIVHVPCLKCARSIGCYIQSKRRINVSKMIIPYSCLNFNKFVVLRVSFADEKSQKSPQVNTLNAGHFVWAGIFPVSDVEVPSSTSVHHTCSHLYKYSHTSVHFVIFTFCCTALN